MLENQSMTDNELNKALELFILHIEKEGFGIDLLKNQQPLGKEFEDVLHDNLWDLYERS